MEAVINGWLAVWLYVMGGIAVILSRYPMNRLTDMITNFGGVVLGCVVLKNLGVPQAGGGGDYALFRL